MFVQQIGVVLVTATFGRGIDAATYVGFKFGVETLAPDQRITRPTRNACSTGKSTRSVDNTSIMKL